MLFTTVLALLPAILAFSIPARSYDIPIRSCPVDQIQVPLIDGLQVPDSEKTNFIMLGRGVQNYTCTAQKFVAVGAVANLYDVSCMITLLQPFLSADQVSDALTSSAVRILEFPGNNVPVHFDHFFAPTAAGGIAPVFRGPRIGVEVVLSVTTRVNAPKDPAATVPWLRLTNVSGSLSKSVFRTHTSKGQPPTSCSNEGEFLSVQYAAMYYFTQ